MSSFKLGGLKRDKWQSNKENNADNIEILTRYLTMFGKI